MGYLLLITYYLQQTDGTRTKIISIFKNIDFKIEIVANLTEVDFLHVTFNLENNAYRPCKKPNDKFIYTYICIYIYIIYMYIIYIYISM